METWHTFAMHIHHGTDLELSPTTTIMVLFLFFFQVTMIPVYKKAVLSLGSFQRYTLYRDMHSESPQVPRRQGAMASRASQATGKLNWNLAVT